MYEVFIIQQKLLERKNAGPYSQQFSLPRSDKKYVPPTTEGGPKLLSSSFFSSLRYKIGLLSGAASKSGGISQQSTFESGAPLSGIKARVAFGPFLAINA